jgi:hypothetical protein
MAPPAGRFAAVRARRAGGFSPVVACFPAPSFAPGFARRAAARFMEGCALLLSLFVSCFSGGAARFALAGTARFEEAERPLGAVRFAAVLLPAGFAAPAPAVFLCGARARVPARESSTLDREAVAPPFRGCFFCVVSLDSMISSTLLRPPDILAASPRRAAQA